jgi:hypothetical protein
MLTDIHYRRCRIVWDTRKRPGAFFWTGKAAVVLPADPLGVKKIHRINGRGRWFSEEDAQAQLLHAAKEWIDDIATSRGDLWSPQWSTSRSADL